VVSVKVLVHLGLNEPTLTPSKPCPDRSRQMA
jgi:hypothetical protein